jgi:hypothetical protein
MKLSLQSACITTCTTITMTVNVITTAGVSCNSNTHHCTALLRLFMPLMFSSFMTNQLTI